MTMDELLTPKSCRERALLFAKGAATCASPKAQAVFASIAKTLIALAYELVRGYGLNVRCR
jgi:hypothetical protein